MIFPELHSLHKFSPHTLPKSYPTLYRSALFMRDSPPESNSELGFQLSASDGTDRYAMGTLLSHGRPVDPSSTALSFPSALLTPDFIRFLCSIPNSPLHMTGNHSVAISQATVATVAFVISNSDVVTRYLSLILSVPRLLSNNKSCGIVRTYCRKRKGLESRSDNFPPMKKRCYSNGCDDKQKLTQILNAMPGELHQRTKGINTLSSISSSSLYKYPEPKNIMLETLLFSESHSGQLSLEVENGNHTCGDRAQCAFLNMDGNDYFHNERCNSGFLFQERYLRADRTFAVEEMVNSFPHPKVLLLEHTLLNSAGSSKNNIDVLHNVSSNTICSSPWLKLDETNIFQTENRTVVQECESLNQDGSKEEKEIPQHDFSGSGGCQENHPTETIYKDAADTDPEKNVTELNNGQFHVAKIGKDHLRSHGVLLNHSTTSTAVSKPDTKKGIDDGKVIISPTNGTCKHLGKTIEQVKTNKGQTPSKQNAKHKGDHNSNTKERERYIENRKKQPFPKFEQFIIEEEEGSGGYGTVYRARKRDDGVKFAIKCPHTNANLSYVHNELKMLEYLGGKDFVIKYEGSVKNGSSDCLVLEHVEHDRPEVLRREITVIQLQWYGYCLFKALAGLHKQGIIHRDVKPGNFLFSRKINKGYLIDFNLALDMSKRYGTILTDVSKGRHNQNEPVPSFQTKSLPPEKNKKLVNTKHPNAVNKNVGKISRIVLPPVDLKKRIGKATAATDTSSKNSIRSHGAEVSGITSARDVPSTRMPSTERLKEPLPNKGRMELLSLVQEAMHDGNCKSVNTPTSKRKRVAAPSIDATPPRDAHEKCFYPTPMPLYAKGHPIGSSGLLKGKADGKRKQDGTCAGTKGFKAPEVLFRSLHLGLKTDIWSAGVTLLYLMIGRTPFVGDTDQNIKEITKLRGSEDLWEVAKIHDRESSFPSDLYDIKYISPMKLQDWCTQNTRRPEFLEAIPRSLYDLVDRCLTVNPRQRISAEEALRHEFFAPCSDAVDQGKAHF